MHPRRVIIIGGGISGLAAAHRLCELGRQASRPLDLTLLEARDRFGGVIETRRQEGCLLEAGPDAFITEKPWALALCRRLGLEGELLATRQAHRRSFIVRRGRLVPVPEGLYLIAPARLATLACTPLISWRGKLRMACELGIPPRRDGQDESVGSFIRRRFGHEALKRIGQPMISGIYTADPERLSLGATMPRFQEMERTHGSVLRALRARARQAHDATTQASGPRYGLFVTLRSGLATLVETLVARMPEARLQRSSPVARITRGASWTITLQDHRVLTAEAVCLALPAHQAATLLDSCAPSLARLLEEIPYESVATVNAAFRCEDLPRPAHGFGFVAPAVEGRQLVGCTFASLKFTGRAPESLVLLRAFVGGALHRAAYALDDAALVAMVRQELRALLGLQAAPVFTTVHRHPQAMPQYHVGHQARVAALQEAVRRYPGLYLTGNGFDGIGLPDCVHQAEETAARLFTVLQQGRPAPSGNAA